MKKIFCIAALLFAQIGWGGMHMLQPGSFGFQGEYLHLHPSFDDTFFVIESSSSTVPIGKRSSNEFNFKPGFRLEAAYAFSCPTNELHLRWTHLKAHHRKSVASTSLDLALLPTETYPNGFFGELGPATSNIHFNFNIVDLFYKKDIYLCCPLNLSFLMGVQYARLTFREDLFSVNGVVNLTTRYHQRTWGAGPELGLAGDLHLFNLCKGSLSITCLSWGSLLGGRQNSDFFQNQNLGTATPTVDTKDDSIWRIVPAFHARLGLCYYYCLSLSTCRELELFIEGGYEFTTYRNALHKTRYFPFEGAGISLNQYSNFDMQGPYLAAGITF
jgi:hypothetical protein